MSTLDVSLAALGQQPHPAARLGIAKRMDRAGFRAAAEAVVWMRWRQSVIHLRVK